MTLEYCICQNASLIKKLAEVSHKNNHLMIKTRIEEELLNLYNYLNFSKATSTEVTQIFSLVALKVVSRRSVFSFLKSNDAKN